MKWVVKNGRAVQVSSAKKPGPTCRRRVKKIRADFVLHHYAIAKKCRDIFARGDKHLSRHHFTHAIPPWSTKEDTKAIRALYQQSRNMFKSTGVKYEIDHIIPLRGKLVCGLHVLSNLRIMEKAKNRSKGNR